MKKQKILLVGLIVSLLLVQLACNLPVRPDFALALDSRSVIPDMLASTSAGQWQSWIEQLSGAAPVMIDGQPAIITTRYNYAMFTGQENARAFEFLQEQVRRWVNQDQIEIDPYTYTDAEHSYTWKNLIVTLPGRVRPDEVVVLSAHFDSTVVRAGNPLLAAPGANDNAVGVATLLEAVRLLSRYRFERTIRMIFFSGEEHGLAGSRAYVEDHPTDNIVALLNLDMFGYDSTGDRCIELHVGPLPASDHVGKAFVESIHQYQLNLTYDYLIDQATDRSDHAPFWEKGVGAVAVIENFFDNNLPDGCQGVDANPNYHKPGDTLENVNVPFAFDVAQAALATTAKLAGPLSSRWLPFPW